MSDGPSNDVRPDHVRGERANRVIVDEAVDYLNELLALDPMVGRLLTVQVPCRTALVEHPECVTAPARDGFAHWVSPLGVLNGLLARLGSPDFVAAVIEFPDVQPLQEWNRKVIGFKQYYPPPQAAGGV